MPGEVVCWYKKICLGGGEGWDLCLLVKQVCWRDAGKEKYAGGGGLSAGRKIYAEGGDLQVTKIFGTLEKLIGDERNALAK